MTTEEKEIFLFEQACRIAAARLGNSALKIKTGDYLERNLQPTYKALEKQFAKCCPTASKK